MDELYERSQWINKSFDYQFGKKIIEYDMKSAGLSLIKEYKLLPEDKINELDSIKDKYTLNVKVGVLCRDDKAFNERFQGCFKLARKRFFEANNISEDDLVSIKKDALFVIDKKCSHTSFGYITFASKNEYTSYMRLNRLEFYMNTKTKKVDIKGLGQGESLDNIRDLHKEYLLDEFLNFARLNELNADNIPLILRRFVHRYRNRELPIGYYRELNQTNSFRVFDHVLDDYTYRTTLPDSLIDDVDISFNYFTYIVPIVNIIL